VILLPHHYAMLHTDRAIAEAIITARGYQSLQQPEDLRDLGFSKAQAKVAPALVIPLWNVHGQPHGWQMRPDTPRQFKDGTVAKYEFPQGAGIILDVHPTMQPLIGDPTAALWVTEGVPKGDSLASQGCCTIALAGVWGFKGTNEHGGKVILPDWKYVALNGRMVYVAFDSDIYQKPQVERALQQLYRFLRERQARPALVQWPEAYRQTKIGIDDYLAQGHSIDDVLAMVPPMGPLPLRFFRRRNGTTPDTPAPPPTSEERALPYSDCTNAMAFVREHGQDLRYCYLWKSWLVWTGTHWTRDISGEVMRRAKQTVKRLARHAEDLPDDEARALMGHVKASLSTAKLKALVECAQSEPGIALQPEDLDSNPWLLNCRNGTLDLRTGDLHPHQQSDLITRCLPVAYDAQATCATWERFQWRIMGGTMDEDDPDTMGAGEMENRRGADARAQRLIRFKQRFAGYALTGETREQCFCVYHGLGANGKSTELETLQALFGDYAQSTPSASLLVKDAHGYEGIPNDIARLRGARLVTAVEIGAGKRLNEELVKRLTGQDTMTARFLYGEYFDFTPEFKLIVACNHLPTIRGTDHAIWRRIHRVPFTVTIPDDEQDKTLPAQLRAELPGILCWLVQGCLDWQREGLGVPEEVHAANKDYRASMDVIGRFIDDCCLVDPMVRIKANDLYDAYKRWCEASGEYAVTLTAFGIRMEEQGFAKVRSGGIWRIGIGLLATNPDLTMEQLE
jgi:putative DNA primase/helicase